MKKVNFKNACFDLYLSRVHTSTARVHTSTTRVRTSDVEVGAKSKGTLRDADFPISRHGTNTWSASSFNASAVSICAKASVFPHTNRECAHHKRI